MKLNLKKRTEEGALALFRAIPKPRLTGKQEDAPVCTRARGNPRSQICLIAPPCSPEDYENDTPFSDRYAQQFEALLTEELDILGSEKMFVISCSQFGVKPCKASTEPVRELIISPRFHQQFIMFVCVGDDAFKHIFGRGKKPSTSTLVGSTIFHPDIANKPLFTFQNVNDLVAVHPEGATERDCRWQEDWVSKRNEVMVKTIYKFRQAVNRFKISL